MPDHGQEGCGIPPATATTGQGLSGLGYLADASTGRGSLIFNPPAMVSDRCKLRFCEERNGQEVEIDLPFARLNQDPSTLPQPTSCGATSDTVHCPIDPATETDKACEEDVDCDVAGGEVCGVFCDDVVCASFRKHCGRRLTTCTSLDSEPSGPFQQQDPSTWPCEEVLECGETGPIVGFTGDPAIKKTGSLAEVLAPPPGTTGETFQRVPISYPSFESTLNATQCDVAGLGSGEIEQFDPRSGGSGNGKWGVFLEPQIEHSANVDMKSFGDDSINVKAKASFRTGARVWGHEIAIISGELGGSLHNCSAEFSKSLKVLGAEMASLTDDGNLAPPTVAESDACTVAFTTVGEKMREVKKSLHDARLAWDEYRNNANQPTAALCARTKEIFGDVESGCTVISARKWIQNYESAASDLTGYYTGEYQNVLAGVRSKLHGEAPLALPFNTPYDGIGASLSYPIGPIVLTLEIELAGFIGAEGKLTYGMDPPLPGQPMGPKASAAFTPMAEAHAYVFAGVGLPGVSVGVEGDLLLLGVSAPLTTGIELLKNSYTDFRPPDSSGLYGVVSGHPSLLGGSSMRRWTADWTYGAGVKLETLSGKLSLAARVRLLFFSKTFRKKLADWKGFEKKFEFVGKLGSPNRNSRTFDLALTDIPFPEPSNVEAAFNLTPVGSGGDVLELGPTNSPGVCGTALKPNGASCGTGAECMSRFCPAGTCETRVTEPK